MHCHFLDYGHVFLSRGLSCSILLFFIETTLTLSRIFLTHITPINYFHSPTRCGKYICVGPTNPEERDYLNQVDTNITFRQYTFINCNVKLGQHFNEYLTNKKEHYLLINVITIKLEQMAKQIIFHKEKLPSPSYAFRLINCFK